MAFENAFTENMSRGFAGQWADITDLDAISAIVERSSVPFGVAVLMGSSDFQCLLPDHGGYFAAQVDSNMTATTDADNPFLGITVYHAPFARKTEQKLNKPIGGGDTGYLAITETASLARHGHILVFVEDDVKKGESVFYRHTLADNAAAPQPQQLGVLSSTDDVTTQQIAGAVWGETAAAGTLATLWLSGARQG